MPRILRFLFPVALALLVGCQDQPVSPDATDGPLLAKGGKPGKPDEAPADPAIATNYYTSCKRENGASPWVINADGSNLTDLSICGDDNTHTKIAWMVSWSPDGKSLVFDGGGLVVVDVVLDAQGTPVAQNERTIAETGEEYDPAWSPDGTTIAYITTSWGRPTEIRTIPATGGTPTIVCSGGCGRNPGWSPDGTQLAFTGDGLLRVLTLATGVIDILIPSGEFEGTSWRPAWSSTGDRIAFTGVKPSPEYEPQSVYVYEVATGAYSLLFEDGRQPAWSPDGEELAIVSRDRKKYGLIVIDPTSGALLRKLTTKAQMSVDWRRCEPGPGCGPGN